MGAAFSAFLIWLSNPTCYESNNGSLFIETTIHYSALKANLEELKFEVRVSSLSTVEIRFKLNIQSRISST